MKITDLVLPITLASLATCAPLRLLSEAPTKELREEDATERRGRLLIVGIDGLVRDLFYEELRAGRLPGFDKLLGGRQGASFPHAYFHERAVAPFPSVTAAGWSSLLTGVPPAHHGVPGNEIFLRESRRFVAPIPMSVNDNGDLLAVYNDQLFAEILTAPTMFTRLHDKGQESWVALNHVHIGADRLLLPGKDDLIEGLTQSLMAHTGIVDEEASYSELDDGMFDTVLDELADEKPPNVLMVYASGTDILAHNGNRPVGEIQRAYLREQIDGRIGELADALRKHGTWHTVIVADHGHTTVMNDEPHAIVSEETAAVLQKAGFVPREPSLGVDDAPHDTVVAPQSGAAFVYVADRSACVKGQCRWDVPPRFEDDVLAVAEAFHQANEGGDPGLTNTLSMILVRKPVPLDQVDQDFGVYRGGGKFVTLAEGIPTGEPFGPAFSTRLHQLAVGPHGERAGDVILVAKTGDAAKDCFYFGKEYGSTHGSASAADSFVPLIVSHPEMTTPALAAIVHSYVGDTAYLHEVTPLMEHLVVGSAD